MARLVDRCAQLDRMDDLRWAGGIWPFVGLQAEAAAEAAAEAERKLSPGTQQQQQQRILNAPEITLQSSSINKWAAREQ